MKQYKYVGKQETYVPFVGILQPGQTFETDKKVDNILFEEVHDKKKVTNSKTK